MDNKNENEKISKKVIVTAQDESAQEEIQPAHQLPNELFVLPIRDSVLFPGTVVPLTIQREKSRRLLTDLLPDNKILLAVCQKDPAIENPVADNLYDVGTAIMVLKLLRMEDGTQNVIVQSLGKARITQWTQKDDNLVAVIEPLADHIKKTPQNEALLHTVFTAAQRVVELSPNIPNEAKLVLNNIDTPSSLADFLAANLPMDTSERQLLLAETDVVKRLEMINVRLQKQLEILELSDKIRSEVKEQVDKHQKEYFLNEQLKAIQKELGQTDDKTVELAELKEQLTRAKLPDAVQKEADREMSRLEKIPSISPDYNVIRTYLEIISELPWSVSTVDKLDVKAAAKVLNADHYGLEKVKRRILEYLAVRKLSPESRGPILCFVGPPGVGKTSLGQSIARAMGRKFIRMSLGGMRDEAELRGHRRTYIGAMPGRVIQELRKAGTNNPVFMLDELDKVGNDFRGDPSSALLEILDPAQNNTFQDHYLNLPFDLSKVLFIATANYMGTVPPALRDRMEVIELPGYTSQEKLEIAKRYLVKRQRQENGLKNGNIRFPDEVLKLIINDYTREAGVRELERQIGAICRGVAARVATGRVEKMAVTENLVRKILGPRQYESELALRQAQPGVVTGLAYTPVGGEILFIESAVYPGNGKLVMTGQIGDVMKESAQAALSLVKGRLAELKLDAEFFNKHDIHIHVPAGAIPKDGPSAGCAMFSSLMSLLMKRCAKVDVAMTGEITLRGIVLPIGGVKEKVLAAKRAGIKTVILPEGNRKNLVDVPAIVKKSLKFRFVRNVDQVLRLVLK
ncbi:MAG TPA: endopeptidase La [Phycisphaerae bacterium]|nr:endopeptidase La [Phycisphaerae bacterium]HPS51965.1 endopeptidase La [Phycisphaerae bacterium]